MFKLMELWDNCKLETIDAQHQFPFFDKHLPNHERHDTRICSVPGH